MRLLVVVAHPDDESFGCGSLLAAASAVGHTTAVLCATRGEAGESRIVTDDLAALREAELKTSAAILGVGSVHLLDHVDSGMTGDPAPGTLVAADQSQLVGEIVAVIDGFGPDIVVTLDASDGHRDHAVIRDATLAAVDSETTHRPEATYLWCLARSSMRRWAEQVNGGRFDDAYLSLSELGTSDDEITTRIDVSAHLETRWKAIGAHASQASPYDDLPAELQHEFLATDRLRLVRGADVLESTLQTRGRI
jgi:N-acetyl-1-D-myo-inositol-2-amino-2-deoxy-alpha-D-glucopyranoside deacetylase